MLSHSIVDRRNAANLDSAIAINLVGCCARHRAPLIQYGRIARHFVTPLARLSNDSIKADHSTGRHFIRHLWHSALHQTQRTLRRTKKVHVPIRHEFVRQRNCRVKRRLAVLDSILVARATRKVEKTQRWRSPVFYREVSHLSLLHLMTIHALDAF